MRYRNGRNGGSGDEEYIGDMRELSRRSPFNLRNPKDILGSSGIPVAKWHNTAFQPLCPVVHADSYPR